MGKKRTSTEKKKADPKYPPEHPPEDDDPDDEDSWPGIGDEDADRRTQ